MKKDIKVSIITLGCSKNTVESESVAGLFVKNGFALTNDLSETDIIVIHTCSFINDAQIESRCQIEQAGILKQKNPNLKIFVSGCLAQLLQKSLKIEYPFIDGYVGTAAYENIVKLIKTNKFFGDVRRAGGMNNSKTRILSSSLPSTYIKIAEGCNHRCSFCIIPDLRGNYTSRPIKSITDEAKALADSGITELNVIAQDTTSYGTDIYGKPALYKLLKETAKIKNLKWIRLLYAYPSTVSKQLLEIISEYDNICNYIDIPIQHISKNILKNMKRPLNSANIIKSIKNNFPDIILRTSLITGFPGETENDFKELNSFIKENYFEHVGIFGYSDQQISSSFKLRDKINQKTIEKRKQILAATQFKNVIKNNTSKIGKVFEVFPEATIKNNVYCRAYFQAPEIDNNIIIKTKRSIPAGKFIKVKISGVKDYDLIAK